MEHHQLPAAELWAELRGPPVKAIITGLIDLPPGIQQVVGQQWLLALHAMDISVDGVRIEFEGDNHEVP
jgi:hypothetical protein